MIYLTIESLLEALKDAPKDAKIYFLNFEDGSFHAASEIVVLDEQKKIRIS